MVRIRELSCGFLFNSLVRNSVPKTLSIGSHMQTRKKETECERDEKQKNIQRIESVGERKEAHPRDDQKILPRQTQSERGRSVRRVQSAYRIRALPSRKMPVQGQQKILFLL